VFLFEKDRRKDDLGPLNANVFSGMEHDLNLALGTRD